MVDIIQQLTLAALKNRRTMLENYGHIRNKQQDQLVVLAFLERFIDRYPLTGEQIKIVERLLSCIRETNCLVPVILENIPWFSYHYNVDTDVDIRITENVLPRGTENALPRMTEN